MDGMPAATARTTFVASKRPPMPTSSTATSTLRRRKIERASAVVASKNVGGWPSRPDAQSRSIVSLTAAASVRRASSSTGRPSTANRSLSAIRCGEVYRPVAYPAARSPRSVMAATEPLPFVPAMRSDLNRRSGLWRAAFSTRMLSSPSFMPNRCRPNR